MARSPRLNRAEIDGVIAAYQDGCTVREIATQINITPSSVWKYLTRNGVKMRSVGARKRVEPSA